MANITLSDKWSYQCQWLSDHVSQMECPQCHNALSVRFLAVTHSHEEPRVVVECIKDCEYCHGSGIKVCDECGHEGDCPHCDGSGSSSHACCTWTCSGRISAVVQELSNLVDV